MIASTTILSLAALLAPTLPIDMARAQGGSTSLAFFVNDPMEHDYGLQTDLPPTFGSAEFTLELWILPDDSFPIGPTGGAGQLTNWSDADEVPYSSGGWWFEGNFLLDGHNNGTFENGTFSLQFYGGGRVRWLFGDGEFAGPGGHWSVGAFPANTTPTLLDGAWHQITLVRRWTNPSGAQLELWIDGALVATETTPARADMRQWWDAWPGFPVNQEGWFWGAEKQAAIGLLSQYEDYKGPIDELRFWDRAKTASEIAASWNAAVDGTEPGLVGLFRFDEGTGLTAQDSLGPRTMTLIDMKPGFWSSLTPPLGGAIFADGFESGNTTQWTTTFP